VAWNRTLELLDPRDPRVESTWRELERAAHPSYFQSWPWVANWLSVLPVDRTPRVGVLREHDLPVAAFLLGHRRLRRHGLLTSDAWYFNASGWTRHDERCALHNGLLAATGARRSLAELIALLPAGWDELYLPAVDRYAFDDLGGPRARRAGYEVAIDREEAAPFVDLDAVRAVGYGELIGPSARAQLRRARELAGEVSLEVAHDAHHALDIYGELLRLHARWHVSRGTRGAFADPWFEQLHRRLIVARAAHGDVQLVRVRARGETLGCLYNLVARDRVTFYRAALATFDPARWRPDLVCHAAAIEHAARAGHAIYDLVGSRLEDRRPLATGAHRLVWLRVHRAALRFTVEDALRRARDALAATPARRALGTG